MFTLLKSLESHLVTLDVVRYVGLHESVFVDGLISQLILAEYEVRLCTSHFFDDFVAF